MQKRIDAGFTLLELLMTMTIMAILMGIAALGLQRFNDPLVDGTAQFEALLRQARVQAMSTTSAVRLERVSATVVKIETAKNCTAPYNADNWKPVSKLTLDLPRGVVLQTPPTPSPWPICFTSRGYTNNSANPTFILQQGARAKQVEVFSGGLVRTVE